MLSWILVVSLYNGHSCWEQEKLTSAAAKGFHIERLQIPLAKEEAQLGFFFSTSAPILIFLITGSGTKSDSWALSSSEGSQ